MHYEVPRKSLKLRRC